LNDPYSDPPKVATNCGRPGSARIQLARPKTGLDAAADLPSGIAEEDPAEAEGPLDGWFISRKTGGFRQQNISKHGKYIGNIACVHIYIYVPILIIEHEGFITNMTWEINRQN